MAYRDLRHFIETLEQKQELKRVTHPVSPYLEITEIADRIMKSNGPALLFENVVGHAHRLGTPNPKSADAVDRPRLCRQAALRPLKPNL